MKNGKKFEIDDYVFVDAAILGDRDFVFLAHEAASIKKQSYRLHVIRLTAGTWTVHESWQWQGIGLAVQSVQPLQVFAAGRDGQIGVFNDGRLSEEHVDPKRAVGPLRTIAILSGSVVACGMKREIFRREPSGTWQRFDRGMAMPPPTGKVDVAALIRQGIKDMGGINAIAQIDQQEPFAFGMRGEIWRFNGQMWDKVDSPTNVMLKDATVVNSEAIYVCGQSGTVIRGSDDRWERVSYSGPPRLDFCSICYFGDRIYLADGHSLRRLDDGELKVVSFGVEEIVPSFLVTASFGQILSVAGQEAWSSRDGNAWESLVG